MKTCLVIGAGISGLIAACYLQKKGMQVTVLEKSRGFGGRMATRRIAAGVFDHGAQFISVHGMFFRVIIEDLQDQGLIREWSRGFLNGDGLLNLDGYLRFCGTQGMAAVAKALAAPLQVELQETITQLQIQAQGWKVQAESGKTWEADALILTPPLPQSLHLLKNSTISLEEELEARLKAVKYDPAVVVMALLDGPSGLPEPGALAQTDPLSPVAWIVDNQIKGISPVPAVTVIGTPHFSRSQWKQDKTETGQRLWQAAQHWIQAQATELEVHRWRFAQVKEPLSENYLLLRQSPPLLLAGDAFGEQAYPLEGAAVSGLEAAKCLLSLTV